MFFGKFSKWESTAKKLQNNEISIQEFVNVNERKTLYYSTPFVSNENGESPNILQTHGSDMVYFPAFTAVSGLKEYMRVIGCAEHIVIKGDLKSVLSSLDSHPLLREWGVVVDPQSSLAIEVPPQIRVQPKCLR